jgi:hypothetical protein
MFGLFIIIYWIASSFLLIMTKRGTITALDLVSFAMTNGERTYFVGSGRNDIENRLPRHFVPRNDKKIVISNSRFIIARNKIMKQPKNAIICYCEECGAERSNPANKMKNGY